MPDVRVRQHRVWYGVNLEHHGALSGETICHLLGLQGERDEGQDVHHEGHHHHHVAPGHHNGNLAASGIQQICLWGNKIGLLGTFLVGCYYNFDRMCRGHLIFVHLFHCFWDSYFSEWPLNEEKWRQWVLLTLTNWHPFIVSSENVITLIRDKNKIIGWPIILSTYLKIAGLFVHQHSQLHGHWPQQPHLLLAPLLSRLCRSQHCNILFIWLHKYPL